MRSTVSIDLGLLTRNATVLQDWLVSPHWVNSGVSLSCNSYRRVHNEMSIQDALNADGIRRDGGFEQHGGGEC
jgi:hypothetical protein